MAGISILVRNYISNVASILDTVAMKVFWDRWVDRRERVGVYHETHPRSEGMPPSIKNL